MNNPNEGFTYVHTTIAEQTTIDHNKQAVIQGAQKVGKKGVYYYNKRS